MLVNIAVYTILILLSYFKAKYGYATNRNTLMKKRKRPLITIVSAIALTILFTLYNVLVTMQGIKTDNITGDRLIYSMNFAGLAEAGSLGLVLLIKFIRLFTDNSEWLFYGTTFICVMITFISFRKVEDTTSNAVLFLVLTQWVFCTIVNLKQCYSVAFSTIFFVFALKRNSIKNVLGCLVSILMAILFHPTGYILLIVYPCMLFAKSNRSVNTILVLCIFIFIFFIPIAQISIKLTRVIAPSLSDKLYQYFGSGDISFADNAISFVKGLPFYYITVIGFLRRKKLSVIVKNYNKYLVLSIFASLVYLLSIYNEWLFRLIYLFYFPIAIFWGQLFKYNINKLSKVIDCVIVLGGLAVVLYRYIMLMYINYGGFSGIF